jgi:hypothetical protein
MKTLNVSKTAVATALATALVAGLVTVRTAHAGYHGTYPIVINESSHVAWGSLGSARNSADGIGYIGCVIYAYPGSLTAQCEAYDANTNYVSCRTSDPALVEGARSLGGDAWLHFQWDPSTLECTGIVVRNESNFEPKH